MEHLALLVFLLALAAGLVTVTVAAQLVHRRRTVFFRAFLANILLFDLLIVLGLVFWYAQFHLGEVSGFVTLTVLGTMAIPKLGWAGAFVIMNRLLLGEEVTAGFKRRFLVACGFLLLAFGVLLLAGGVRREPSLVELANAVVEVPTIGMAVAAAVALLIRTRRLPAGRRRRALAVFGSLHLVLFAAFGGSPFLGRFHPLTSGGIMILYNLLPLAWIYRYLPVGPDRGAGPFRLLLADRPQDFVQPPALQTVGKAAGEQLVEHQAQSVDIGGGGDRRTQHLFRGGVLRGHHPRLRRGRRAGLGYSLRIEPFGDTEVEELGLPLGGDEDVVGLEIAVHHQVAVGKLRDPDPPGPARRAGG